MKRNTLSSKGKMDQKRAPSHAKYEDLGTHHRDRTSRKERQGNNPNQAKINTLN